MSKRKDRNTVKDLTIVGRQKKNGKIYFHRPRKVRRAQARLDNQGMKVNHEYQLKTEKDMKEQPSYYVTSKLRWRDLPTHERLIQ